MKFTDSHEWIKIEGNIGTVGISDYAKEQLGEVVHIELPKIDTVVTVGDEVVVLESTKAAADIYSPVSGKIVAINESLKNHLDSLNLEPEKTGWLFKIKCSDFQELEGLYNKDEYLKIIGK